MWFCGGSHIYACIGKTKQKCGEKTKAEKMSSWRLGQRYVTSARRRLFQVNFHFGVGHEILHFFLPESIVHYPLDPRALRLSVQGSTCRWLIPYRHHHHHPNDLENLPIMPAKIPFFDASESLQQRWREASSSPRVTAQIYVFILLLTIGGDGGKGCGSAGLGLR